MDIYDIIEKHIQENNRVVIAIDGPSGSGKSTLGKKLKNIYDCNLFHIDDYFLPTPMKTKERLAVPGGNFHHERILKEVFDNLNNDMVVFNSFDCTIQKLGIPATLENKKITIIEGVYAQHPLLSSYYTLKVFLTVSQEEQLKRIEERSGSRMLEKWVAEWIPLENQYFDAFSIEINADYSIKL